MSRSTSGFVLGRRAIAAAGVAALALSLAACGDAATAPASPTARETASPSRDLIGSGRIPSIAAFATVKIVDINGIKILDPVTVKFTSFPSGDSVLVKDNESGDLDATVGVIKAALKPGTSYEACFHDAYFYMNDNRDPVTYPQCSTVTTASYTVDLGKVFGRRMPRITFLSKDNFGAMVVPGGTLQITLFGWTGIIADSDKNFGGSWDGKIVFETRSPPTTVTWCEYSPPPKYALLTAKCGTINTEFDKLYTVTWVHEQLLY